MQSQTGSLGVRCYVCVPHQSEAWLRRDRTCSLVNVCECVCVCVYLISQKRGFDAIGLAMAGIAIGDRLTLMCREGGVTIKSQ